MRHTPRPLLICLSTLALVACDGGVRVSSTRTEQEPEDNRVLKAVSQLQCPDDMGPLIRKGSAMAEGSICTYAGPRGATVTLHLVKLDGEPVEAVLAKFEKVLIKGFPGHGSTLTKSDPVGDAEAAVAVEARGEDAEVRLPGMHIETEGDKASVRIGGIHIKADDSTGEASITSADDSVNVQAHEGGAEVRTKATGKATRTSWILTDSRGAAEGWKLVAYEARGPEGGPIVVATVKSKDDRNDSLIDAAKDLVTLNVGK